MNWPGRLLVIANPTAGRGRARRVQSAVEAYLATQGAAADFRIPGSVDEIRGLVRPAPDAGYSAVVALGGDGTFHQILNAAHGLDLPLGLIPAGGGDDIARALGIPRDPLEAAHNLLRGRVQRVDAIRFRSAEGRMSLYVGAGGAGLDAEAAHLANTRFRRVPGLGRYLAAAVASFRKARCLEIRLEADGREQSCTALLVAVANVPSYGGGVRIAPEASPFDGWMDVAIVAPLRWSQLLDGLLLALNTGDIRWPEMRRLRARSLRLWTDHPAIFHGDGEVLGETPAELEIMPGALPVLI